MLTRKHFEAIAKIISQNNVDLSQDPTDHERGRQFQSDLIAYDLIEYFASENPNFDRVRFMEACEPK